MSCPTCSHTMQCLWNDDGDGVFHCPRCGTVQWFEDSHPTKVIVPKLVERCRTFEATITGVCAEHSFQWKSLGVAESIYRPEERP